jgi:hypothetical protein
LKKNEGKFRRNQRKKSNISRRWTLPTCRSSNFSFVVVNKIIKIRLDPEDEMKGCDVSEHFQGRSCERIYKIEGLQEQKIDKENGFDRYKPFHVNQGFDKIERL